MNDSRFTARLLLLIVGLCLTVASLFAPWATLSMPEGAKATVKADGKEVAEDDPMGEQMASMFGGLSFVITGLNGNVQYGAWNVPNAVPVSIVGLGLLATIANTFRRVTISRKLVIAGLVVGLLMSLRALWIYIQLESTGPGSLFLVGAALIGLSQQKTLRTTKIER